MRSLETSEEIDLHSEKKLFVLSLEKKKKREREKKNNIFIQESVMFE